ncbi:MAG: CDP-glycerol:poly(glycerophosphate) glycerophosphotransferase, partial [uncultured Solirubrobacteraceae bacterium]
ERRDGGLLELARALVGLPARGVGRAPAPRGPAAAGLGRGRRRGRGPARGSRARGARLARGARRARGGPLGGLERRPADGLVQAPRLRLPADVARHAVQAHRLRRREPHLPRRGVPLRRRARARGGQVGHPALPEPVLHPGPARRVPLRGRDPRDGLPPQRPPAVPGARGGPGARARGARAPRGRPGRPLRPHLARHVRAQARARPAAPAPRARRGHDDARPRPRAHRPHRPGPGRPRRAQRLPLARHDRAVPRRGRAHHGLLLRDVRLRHHGQAAPALHARPRALPRPDPRLHLPLRGRGAGAAAADLRRGGGRAGRRRGRHGAVPRALRGLGRALLPVGRRRCGRARRGGGLRPRKGRL